MKRYTTLDVYNILAQQPRTVHELMQVLGTARSVANYHLARCRQSYPVYVSGWRRTTGAMAPVYAVGNGRDVPPLTPLFPKPQKKAKPELKGAWG